MNRVFMGQNFTSVCLFTGLPQNLSTGKRTFGRILPKLKRIKKSPRRLTIKRLTKSSPMPLSFANQFNSNSMKLFEPNKKIMNISTKIGFGLGVGIMIYGWSEMIYVILPLIFTVWVFSPNVGLLLFVTLTGVTVFGKCNFSTSEDEQ